MASVSEPPPMPAGAAPARSKYAEFLADAVIQSRGDLEVSRQLFGGDAYYVLRDAVSFQSRSLSARDYRVYSAIDGTQTCSVVFQHLVDAGILRSSDEEEYYSFLLALHQRGLLNLPIANGKALFERHKTRQKRQQSTWMMKLLCWKISFGNPDSWLNQVTGPLKILMTIPAAAVWLVAACFASWIVAHRWDEFATPFASLLAMQNIISVMVILIVLKVWHEVGHAVATKTWGGEVPDYGVLLILGTPCAFVDASSAWMMPSRRKRIAISAAGMYFEAMIAVIAVAVWALSNDPLVKSLAHHTIFLSTLTTVLFNANPLMKFDGYFILSDLLDIPNLKSRADESFRWMIKRFLLGLNISRPSGGLSTNLWLASFGAASGVYKILIVSGIVAVLTWQLPFGGLWLAGLYVVFSLGQAGYLVLKYLWTHPETLEQRRQAWLVSVVVAFALSVSACWPVKQTITTLAVTEFSGEYFLRSPAEGTIKNVFVVEGDQVRAGQSVVQLASPSLDQLRTRLANEVQARELQFRKASINNEEQTEQYRSEWLNAVVELEKVERQMEELLIKAPANGVVTEWSEDAGVGRRLADGEVFAQLGTGNSVIRTLLRQHRRQLIQPQVGETVWITFPWEIGRKYEARVDRIKLNRVEHVRETALTSLAGGEIEIDPNAMTPLEDVYMVEATFVDPPDAAVRRGVRAKIHFENRSQSLAGWTWHRWLDFYRRYQQSM